jgi:hypothetical protein
MLKQMWGIADLIELLNFLSKIRDNKSIKGKEYKKSAQILSEYQVGSFTLDKLTALYHENKLNVSEKLLIAKF